MTASAAMSGLTLSRPALAIILARAGSRGLPGKNRMLIADKPCAQWTIEHALAAKTVGAVALSTDDAQLMDLGRSMSVDVVPRPLELASDTATVDSAARQAVTAWLDSHPTSNIRHPASIVILYANVPVRPPDLIDRAVDRLIGANCDSVQSYAPVGKFHPWWMTRIDADSGAVGPWEGEVLNHNIFRRQDLPPCFVPDGGVIAVTRRALFHEIAGVTLGPHAFFGLDRRGVINDEGAVIDIDSATDAALAEATLSRRDSA